MDKPRIGITLGDPAGIGSEILAKVFNQIRTQCVPVLYGCKWSSRDGIELALVAPNLYENVDFVDVGIPKPRNFKFGEVSATCGEIAISAAETAIGDAIAGKLDAIMTCPLNKLAIHAAGSQDMGHQEILARMTKSKSFATMLMTPNLRVVHLSTHHSLIEAARLVTQENVLEKIKLTAISFEQWGLAKARIAIAALNPHNGEGGLLGREELDEITPAVEQARREGIEAYGPFPCDSIFNRAIEGEFDVILAMYHDQGHIAIKVYNIHESISATLGLPFVRTSVDHGTAFDIAGKGIANPRSTLAAIDAAIVLSSSRLGQGTAH